MMRTLRASLLALAAMFGGCGGSALDGVDVGRLDQDLVTVTVEDVAGLPPCGLTDPVDGETSVCGVLDSGGLFAVSVDGRLVCVDDLEGLEGWGLEAPEQELGGIMATSGSVVPDGSDKADGTPLPARDHGSDGTPLPATPGDLRSDGTPLPALI
jgi:hypothetical protein